MLSTLRESSSGVFQPPLGLAGFVFLPTVDDAFDAGVEGEWRSRGRTALLVEAVSLPTSLSVTFRLSHGLAAIHRSVQLHPQLGLLGSANVDFTTLDPVFHCIQQ